MTSYLYFWEGVRVELSNAKSWLFEEDNVLEEWFKTSECM